MVAFSGGTQKSQQDNIDYLGGWVQVKLVNWIILNRSHVMRDTEESRRCR